MTNLFCDIHPIIIVPVYIPLAPMAKFPAIYNVSVDYNFCDKLYHFYHIILPIHYYHHSSITLLHIGILSHVIIYYYSSNYIIFVIHPPTH